MAKRDVLEQTAREYFSSAQDELGKKRFNSAVVLFFKALVAVADLYILLNTGKAPSSHTGRFKMTKERFPEVYDLLDKDFPFYQDSYVQLMSQETAEVIRDDTKALAGKIKLKLQ